MRVELTLVFGIFGLLATVLYFNVAHAVAYSITDLGTLGGTYATANRINNHGQVTGSSKIAGDTETRAFLFDGAALRDLGKLEDTHSGSDGNGINDSAHVAGTSYMYSSSRERYACVLKGLSLKGSVISTEGRDLHQVRRSLPSVDMTMDNDNKYTKVCLQGYDASWLRPLVVRSACATHP